MIHRHGRLAVGEPIMMVATAAPHRADAKVIGAIVIRPECHMLTGKVTHQVTHAGLRSHTFAL